MAKKRLLVVGNGMAGVKFLEEIVAGAAGDFAITVAGAEPDPAYNRVLLSPLLAGEITLADLQTRPRAWYEEHAITLLTGAEVVSLDRSKSCAVLADGRSIEYDICVLATGSDPIRLNLPGSELPGVEVFRSIADAARLSEAGRTSANAIVIGGGLLGIEAAHGLSRAGASVTLLHVMDRLMERQLDAAAGQRLKAALEAKGITVVLSADTARIEGGAAVERLILKSGETFQTSLVVMAVGVRPRCEIARAAAVECRRGVVVDDQMRSSDPAIFAIGECAEHRGAVYGLVEPAYEQARVAAQTLAGQAASYHGTVLATNLKVSGVPVFSAGDFDGDGAEQIVWSDDIAGAYRKFVVRGGKLEGVVMLGDTLDALWYRDLIRSGDSIAPIRANLAFGRASAEAA